MLSREPRGKEREPRGKERESAVESKKEG